MNLAAFHSNISATIRRGTSVDALIPGWVEQAARFLELDNTFEYMKEVVETQTTVDSNLLTLAKELKRVEFVRLVGKVEGQAPRAYIYLNKVEPKDVLGLESAWPVGYWNEGSMKLRIDTVPNVALDLEIGASFLTDWPTDTTETPTLLKRYMGLLRAQTMLEAARELKDVRMAEDWAQARKEQLAVVFRAEEELVWNDQSITQEYIPFGALG